MGQLLRALKEGNSVTTAKVDIFVDFESKFGILMYTLGVITYIQWKPLNRTPRE